MKREVFLEYCEFLFPLLAQLKEKFDYSPRSEIGTKFLSYCAERILGCFLTIKKSLNIKHLDTVLTEHDEPTIEPIFDENAVVIAMSSSVEYLPYTSVYVQSIIDNSSLTNNYDIFIFTTNIQKEYQRMFLKMIDGKKNISIRFVDPEPLLNHITITNPPHYGRACIYRLVAPIILKNYKKVIFTDIDIIFESDPATIFATELDGFPIGACIDITYMALLNTCKRQEKLEYWANTLKLEKSHDYYNTGVMLIDIPQFLKNNYVEQLLNLLNENEYELLEQDALNALFKSRIKYLNLSCNVVVPYHLNDTFIQRFMPINYKNIYLTSLENPIVLHWTAIEKPWNTDSMTYSDKWWQFARKTPFYELIYANYIRNTQFNLLEQAKDNIYNDIINIKNDIINIKNDIINIKNDIKYLNIKHIIKNTLNKILKKMQKSNVVTILGAGLAGLGAAYRLRQLGKEYIVYEKEEFYGGLCQKIVIDRFIFDRFVHFSFTEDSEIRQMFESSAGNYISHFPDASNYYQQKWLAHPAQNNLYPLSEEEKTIVLQGFKDRSLIENPKNYQEWLDMAYGKPFAERFPYAYTRKYWTIAPSQLEIKWVGSRVLKSKLSEVEEGCRRDKPSFKFYTKEMRYPVQGGYQAFIDGWVETEPILYDHKLVKWDVDKKLLFFQNGSQRSYEKIISTLPLPYIISIMEGVPENVLEASNKLYATKGITISIGLKGQLKNPMLWFYVYDEDILFARVYSPSIKSPNNAPEGHSSLQAEIYYSDLNDLKMPIDQLAQHTLDKLVEMDLIDREQIVFAKTHQFDYVNVIFTHDIYECREIVKNWLLSKGIYVAGRFGEWAYLWSDQAVRSGLDMAESIMKNKDDRKVF